jgi:hypothetical protein
MRPTVPPFRPRRAGPLPTSRRLLRLLLPALALWLAAACARSGRAVTSDEPAEVTELQVQNQAFLDMTIYVVRSSERVRIGQARGNSTTTLRIPPSMLTGPTPLRFLADPIGSSRTPVSSEIVVTPGEQVSMVIPPT